MLLLIPNSFFSFLRTPEHPPAFSCYKSSPQWNEGTIKYTNCNVRTDGMNKRTGIFTVRQGGEQRGKKKMHPHTQKKKKKKNKNRFCFKHLRRESQRGRNVGTSATCKTYMHCSPPKEKKNNNNNNTFSIL